MRKRGRAERPGPEEARPSRSRAIACGVAAAALLLLLFALPDRPTSAPEPTGPRWVPGDLHLHTEALAQNDKPDHSLEPEEVREELRARDLKVGALLVWGVRAERTAAHFTGGDVPGDGPILHVDLEVSSFHSFVDHIIALGLKDLAFPNRLYTLPINRWALDQGAVVGVAHANHWAPDLDHYPVRAVQDPSELPLCLALGQPLFLGTELVDSPGFRTLFYALLDCGFTVPLAGGSDWPVAGSYAGECRTFVLLEGPLTYAAWIDGIRRGRTIVSAGDLAIPTIGGAGVGDTLDVRAGATVTLLVRSLLSERETIEVVANDAVIGTATCEAGASELRLSIVAADSGWVCVRSRRIHTGAIYVRVDGRPIRANPIAPQYFAGWVDALVKQLREPTFVVEGNAAFDTPAKVDAEREAAIAAYTPAKAVFERLRAEAQARAAQRGSSPALRAVQPGR